jgi:hypothetical protein
MTRILTSEYSFRLLSNFGTHRDYRVDLDAAKGPLTLIAGANDELMFAGKYEETVRRSRRRKSMSASWTTPITWMSSARRRRFP